jgi:hypothetical protein
MADFDETNCNASVTTTIKPCPFCAGQAKLTASTEPLRYGVICLDCPAEIPPLLLTQEVAIRIWNRRSGLAAIGGQATKGIMTQKKRKACQKNLELARAVKRSKQIAPPPLH